MTTRPRIFVQIASYRDPECVHTVKSLFEQASHPERIFVGICNQYDSVEDAHIFCIPWTRESQVRQKHFHYNESQGIGWARATAQTLWQDEEYTLGIDAHMRFVKGWDEELITQLHACPTENAILTTLLPGYVPPNQLQDIGDKICFLHVKSLHNGIGNPLFNIHGGLRDPERVKDGPFPAGLWIGNFLFCRSEVQERLPHDPYIYFHGEEMSYSVRLFTHGYDIFQPNKTILYHQWKERDTGAKRVYRHNKNEKSQLSHQRMLHLIGLERAQTPKAIEHIEQYGLGNKRSIQQFFEYAGINYETMAVAPHASKGTWPAHPPCSDIPVIHQYNESFYTAPQTIDSTSRIFVQIASYRDPECQWTVKDLFEKAAHPERILVGICWQYDPEEDAHCFEVEAPFPDQVRIDPWHWNESKGVCWARNRTQQLWQGEEYTLMIDSHMRFVEGWDTKMIAELHECDSQKPILTCHPASYTPPNQLQENPKCTFLRAHMYSADGDIRFKGEFLDKAPPKPLNGAFIAAGFMFSKANLIREVPYDPHLYFNQEEVSLAVRFYTYGWDVFSSKQQLLYHYYNTPKPDVKTRPLHWQDNKKWQDMQAKSRQRLDHLFGVKPAQDPEAVIDLPKYALGAKRNLKQFIEYSGLDVQKKVATERALRSEFIKDLRYYKTNPVFVPEIDKEVGKWPETASMQSTQSQQNGVFLSALKAYQNMPYFRLPDQNGTLRDIQNYAGFYVALYFLPMENKDAIRRFFAEMLIQQETLQSVPFQRMYIFNASPDALQELQNNLQIKSLLLSDVDGALATMCGISESNTLLHTVILDPNLRVLEIQQPASAQLQWELSIHSIQSFRKSLPETLRIQQQAPAIIVSEAIPQTLCDRLIHYFENGSQYKGPIGADGNHIVSNAKRRTDVDINDGELLLALDDALSKTVFAEIRKVAGYQVTHRERYKIGCYDATDEGHYTQHRDTGVPSLTYRRYSMSLCIGGEYEGGALQFTEYPGVEYKLAPRTALSFPSCLLHRVTPVTKGKRYVLIAFTYGDEEDAYRKQYIESTGGKYSSNENALKTNNSFKGIVTSPDVYTNRLATTGLSAAPAEDITTIPHPRQHADTAFDEQLLANGHIRKLHLRKNIPEGVLIFENYLEPNLCRVLADYADAQTFTKLNVVDHEKSDKKKVVTAPSDGRVTDHVNIDGMSGEILSIFNDVYCNRLSPFYKVNFEWYERPQILRYPAGGKYNQHADADHWLPDKKKWVRTQDRDYSVLLYLNEEYEGGELEFNNYKYKFKPKTGMLVGFPSGHQYLHAAHPTTSGIRYVIVSWAAILGTPRVRPQAPYASVFVRQKRF